MQTDINNTKDEIFQRKVIPEVVVVNGAADSGGLVRRTERWMGKNVITENMKYTKKIQMVISRN